MDNIHTLLSNGLPSINGKLNAINCGGCGLFALELSKALMMHDIPASIVLVEACFYDEGDVANFISGASEENISDAYLKQGVNGSDPCIGHICVVIDGVLYDSNGQHERPAISESISHAAMAHMLTLPEEWNDTFLCSNNMSTECIVTVLQEFFTTMLSPLKG
jgi:hypothetical protein